MSVTDIEDEGDAEGPDLAIDELDRQIVRLLREDGRMTTSALSRRLKIAEPTARRRLRRLIANGGIHIRALMDPRKITPSRTLTMFRISVLPAYLKSAVNEMSEFPETAFVAIVNGKHNVTVSAFFESREAAVHFMTERLGQTPGITDIEVIDTLKIVKLGQSWAPDTLD